MKLKLLLAFVACSLVACSSDDGAPVNPVAKELKTINGTYHNILDGSSTETVTEFDNNKIVTHKVYSSGQLVGQINYTYSNAGLLISQQNLDNAGQVAIAREYEYDNQGRMTSFTYYYQGMSAQPNVKTFVYNNNNTITYTQVNANGTHSGTYYLNGEGMIYKMTSPGLNEEVEYLNNNLVSHVSDVYGTSTYTYDTQHPVKGEFVNRYSNSYGTYKPNIYMALGFSAEDISEDYILSVTSVHAGADSQYQYEFDDEGYPVERREYHGDFLYSELLIVYE